MKKNIKAIIAALLAAVMCLTLAGCGDGDSKRGKDIEDWTEDDWENALNELDGSKNSEPEQSAVEPEPEEYIIAMTDEIQNADFGSGLIQMNNEVFRQGGYLTVTDFVEQYKDSYDIFYHASGADGTYEECKDYLVEYEDFKDITGCLTAYGAMGMRRSIYGLTNYYLLLQPKQGDKISQRKVKVFITNVTSPDKKIAVSDAIVIGCGTGYYTSGGTEGETCVPVWAPGGFGVDGNELNRESGYKWSMPAGLETVNENYTYSSFKELLEELGYTEIEKSLDELKRASLDYDKKYYHLNFMGDSISFYAAGEENLFGVRPLYQYYVKFDKNTDKIEGEIRYQLAAFVTE